MLIHLNTTPVELHFTQVQKEAVIYALYQISKGDGKLEEEEIQFLQRAAELLGEGFNHLTITKMVVKASSEHLHALVTLNEAQKEWFVVAAYSLIHCDDKLFDEEFAVAHSFFDLMDIDIDSAHKAISFLK